MKVLEICAADLASVCAAAEAGADRVELCSALEVGGLTPSAGLVEAALERARQASLAVRVLIRPRPGDFCYTANETDLMCRDIAFCARAGVEGVVIGALDAQGNIDDRAIEKMIAAWKINSGKWHAHNSLTFHRAFDRCTDPFDMLERLIALGFDTLLTSGQQLKAEQGIPLLAQLHERAAGRIRIMAGSGVSPQNARAILQQTGVDALHLSASCSVPSAAGDHPVFGMPRYCPSDAGIIRQVRREMADF